MKEFDELLHAAREDWPALHRCLAAGGASEAELTDVEKRLCCDLPLEVRDFYRRTKLTGAKAVEPLLDVYTFYPFDWFEVIRDAVLNLWRTDEALLLPLMSDGCGVEICWEIRPEMKGAPRLLLREYEDVRPCFDSIRTLLCSLTQGIGSGVFPMKDGEDDAHARRIFGENNPASRMSWEKGGNQ
jgi:hypothetical protein